MKRSNKKLIRILTLVIALVLLTVTTLCIAFCGRDKDEGDNTQQNENTKIHMLNGKEISIDVAYNLDNVEGVSLFSNSQPTCSEYGKGFFTCDCCNELQLIFIATTPHNFKTEVSVAPTCIEEGEALKTCTDCGKKEYEPIEALGHSFIYDVTENSDGTFTLNGECNCGIRETNVKAESRESTKSASCTENGIISYHLEDGRTIEVKTEKLLHLLNGIEMELNEVYDVNTYGITEFSNVPASCNDNGKGYFICDVCDEMQMVLLTKEHNFTEYSLEILEQATCTENGKGLIYCSECGTSKDYEISALGHTYIHTYDDATKNFNAECDCGNTVNFIAESVNVLKEPTCEENGITIYSNADASISITIKTPKANHKLNGIEIDPNLSYDANTDGIVEFSGKEATCTKAGEGYYSCDDCSNIQLVLTTPTEHNYENKSWIVTENGINYECIGYICSKCGDRIITSKEIVG